MKKIFIYLLIIGSIAYGLADVAKKPLIARHQVINQAINEAN